MTSLLCKMGLHHKREVETKHAAGICYNTWYECTRCDKKSILSWAVNGIKSFKGWKDKWEVMPADFKSWTERENEHRKMMRDIRAQVYKERKYPLSKGKMFDDGGNHATT